MSNVTVTLSKAINVEGVEVQELTLREPTVKDLQVYDKAGGSELNKTLAMVEQLADIPRPAINALAAKDFFKLSKVIEDFLDDTPPTGGN